MRGRSVLITGAGGFIGGHLAGTLVAAGARVRGFVRYTSRGDRGTLSCLAGEVEREIEVVTGDLRDVESVAAAMDGVDVVFHLGAQVAIPYSYVNPRDFFETNVLGTLNVAQAAVGAGVQRMLHLSTSEVYGTAQQVPITEAHPLEPQSPYAASKLAADKLVDSWRRTYGLPATTVRPFNTYGPHQSARAIVPTIVTQALAGGPIHLGSLDPRRDLTFVTDTVAGCIAGATADAGLGHTINLGTGSAVSVGELVERVGAILGRTLEVAHDERRVRPPDSEVRLLLSDPSRAAQLIAWRPAVDLDEGLVRTIDWFAQRSTDRAADYAT